ncbi:hypothetical protein FF2_022141 [Malus domestica]
MITTLCFLQFWLGLGIGGDYSLSATIMSEYANKKTRGAFIATVFAMQGFGILAGGIVTLIVATHLIRLSRLLHTLWIEPLLLHIKLTLSSAASDMSKVLQVQFEAEEEELEKITQEKSNSFGLFTKQFVARPAAAGKAGAIVGAFGFLYAAQSKDATKTDAGYPPGIGVKNSLIMLGVINFVGMGFTLLVPESKGKSLEELIGENEEEKATEQQAASATAAPV